MESDQSEEQCVLYSPPMRAALSSKRGGAYRGVSVQPGQRGPSHGMLCLEPGGLPLPDLQVLSRVCEVLGGAPHLAMPLVAGVIGTSLARERAVVPPT